MTRKKSGLDRRPKVSFVISDLESRAKEVAETTEEVHQNFIEEIAQRYSDNLTELNPFTYCAGIEESTDTPSRFYISTAITLDSKFTFIYTDIDVEDNQIVTGLLARQNWEPASKVTREVGQKVCKAVDTDQ